MSSIFISTKKHVDLQYDSNDTENKMNEIVFSLDTMNYQDINSEICKKYISYQNLALAREVGNDKNDFMIQ